MTIKESTNNRLNEDLKGFHLQFKYPWRPEQSRVLNNVLEYLDDNRVHIVAAPGAGKTNLGLEIFNRLRFKTLVVSPTRLIRNQWIDRLSDFEVSHPTTQWCSMDLKKTQFLTSTTYQGLFSLDKKILDNKHVTKQEQENFQYQCISEWFNQHHIKLLILDEAHHLKSEWWKVLMKFVSTSKELIIISLTATPPIDSSVIEWSRYEELCGKVDEQISIPELVKSNSLCPHQDYIWLVNADKNQSNSLIKYRQNLVSFIDELKVNLELHYLLELHLWLDENQELNITELLENLDECFALLSILKLNNRTIPQRLLELLEIKQNLIPEMDTQAWETLLQSFIEAHNYPQAKPIDEYRQVLITLLRSKRYLRKDKVNLDNTKHKIDSFSKSNNRVKACFDIAQVEYSIRKKWMRLVILSDFIRDEKFQLSINDTDIQTGAYPIFHYFIHHLKSDLSLKTVLLTGRLCIAPKNLLTKIANHLANDIELITKNYSENNEFCCIKTNGQQLTRAITKLHQQGDVMILIGTRSLLGEGWDAPHVNSLIMATQTGAFVTTNQIRGRAIRVDRNNELKTSSIWHIISSSSDALCDKYIFEDLNKRFKTFAGLHAKKLTIESGINRLELYEEQSELSKNDLNRVELSNQMMSNRLENDVFNLKARWQNALEQSVEHKLVSGIHFQVSTKTKNTLNKYTTKMEARIKRRSKTLKYLAFTSIGLSPLLYPFIPLVPLAMASTFSVIGLTLSKIFIDSKPKYFAKYYSHKFAEIILESLIALGRIKESKEFQTYVKIENLKNGHFRFYLLNASHKDNNVFLEALSQLLEPVKLARYLIVLQVDPKIEDIFAVPHVFGVNLKTAKAFYASWVKTLPEFKSCQLIPTAKDEGRKLLLKLQANNRLMLQKESETIKLVERWQ